MDRIKTGPGIDSDDIIMQQYPSPTTDGHDISFYGTNSRDNPPIDPQMEQQALQPLEPPTPQQHGQRSSVSAEELQLAAQLSQGLAPMMQASNTQDEQGLAGADQSLVNHDPNLARHDPSLQSQALALHGYIPQHEQQDQQYAEPGHHEQQGQPYTEAAQSSAQTQLPPHVQMAQMAQQAYANVDNIPPRKRSKVSRVRTVGFSALDMLRTLTAFTGM